MMHQRSPRFCWRPAAALGLLALCGCSGALGSKADEAAEEPLGVAPATLPGAGEPTSTSAPAAPLVSPAADCTDAVDVGATPLTRLSSLQFKNAVESLFGVAVNPGALSRADERGGAFVANVNAPVGELVAEEYKTLAEIAAVSVVSRLDSVLSCEASALCAREFIVEYGGRAYRRPLSESQIETLLVVFEVGDDFEMGIQLVVETLLQSPNFIYRVEATTPADNQARPLDDFELAARLSLSLQNTIPDAELFAAAQAGTLTQSGILNAQAERLLMTPEAGEMIADFHQQWLGLEAFDTLEKDANLFPGFDDQLRQSMLQETRRFTEFVVREDDGRLETLFNASYSFLEGPLFGLYGMAEPQGHDPTVAVELEPNQRGGLLTHAALLAANAHRDQSSPILRGLLVRQNFLCQTLPDPPPNVANAPPAADNTSTTRERFALHTAEPSCAGCHSLIDPVGLSFESYDAVGRFRTAENGVSIDTRGQINGLDGTNVSFDGVRELSLALSRSASVQDCVAKQWFQYLLSRPEGAADRCSSAELRADFARSDYNIRQLLVSIATSDTFLHTKALVP